MGMGSFLQYNCLAEIWSRVIQAFMICKTCSTHEPCVMKSYEDQICHYRFMRQLLGPHATTPLMIHCFVALNLGFAHVWSKSHVQCGTIINTSYSTSCIVFIMYSCISLILRGPNLLHGHCFVIMISGLRYICLVFGSGRKISNWYLAAWKIRWNPSFQFSLEWVKVCVGV